MRVLKKHLGDEFRLFMLKKTDIKMCCNHLILTSLVFEYYDPKRYVMWSTEADLSEETPGLPRLYAIQEF